ncbi:uncharacterized protein N0V89_008540 [Didymosphaeria variabile]|uniref:Uncharacterized protein n=1 Tax=Didymosphaeria variabile TaxID=1932322 RepID=A0A9W8XG55_9PLEO|nr:uncharacterized protein N0V89_008540 [Didymosphaeria variabile]KAJ4349920.1 hypothetical protein N0V89_008540 [Didymosphaeria variabile]
MSRFSFFLGVLLFLLPAQHVFAANTIIWKNRCDYDLYFWVIPPLTPERDDAFTVVPARGEHVHTMVWHKDGGISLKYRDVPYYTRAPAGILQAEYTLDRNQGKTFYDSSIINCGRGVGPQDPSYCPFAHGGVNMYIVGDRGFGFHCEDAYCRLGGNCDKKTYLIPGGYKGEPSFSCPLGVDIVFETCTEASVERTWQDGKPGPAPALWQPRPPPPSRPSAAPWPQQHTLKATTTRDAATVTNNVSVTGAPQPMWPNRPETYPVPDGFPDKTICFDADCWCYGFWGNEQPGRADCGDLDGVLQCYFFQDCEQRYRTGRKRYERD